MDISHLFNKTVSTLRGTTVVTNGSAVTTYAENIASLECRIQGSDSSEPVQAGRKFSKISLVIYCAYETDLLDKDKVVYNGITYNVISTNREENDNTYLMAKLEKSE